MEPSNTIKISRLAGGFSPFYVMETLERAKAMERSGADVVHLEVGEPDLPTPSEVCDAAVRAIRQGDTFYSSSLGTQELRERIAEAHNLRYGLKITADNVLVTSGSSPALLIAMMCAVNPGDEVVITSPRYACYPGIIKASGAVAVNVPVYEDENYQIDTGRVKKVLSAKTGAIVLNSPANPTGAVLEDGVLQSVCSLGVPVISDEIYHGLEYGVKSKSIFNYTDKAVAVNGFSKLCSMTGWRLGYMVADAVFIRAAQKLQQNLFISPNPFVQTGGIAAVEKIFPRAEAIAETYRKRREAMIKSLACSGLAACGNPQGAFYVFVKIPGKNNDSRRLASDILEKTAVAVTPGIDFGSGGEGHLRLSYAASEERIEEGVKRIGDYLKSRHML